MISAGDDYMIHQSHQLLRYPVTSDRRFYDRHFLTGHACDDRIFFMLGVGTYPNLGVIDAYASVAFGGTQYTTRGSRELGVDRMATTDIGPIDIEVVEGLRTLRFRSKAGEDGVEVDLTWNAAVEMFEEPSHFERVLGRVVQEGTRLVQTGTWSGSIRAGGERFEVEPGTWWGSRDRSWGVRSMGLEREPKGIAQAHRVSVERPPLWIWSPMQFEDQTLHFSLSEYADGRRALEVAKRLPGLGTDGEVELLSGIEHDLVFDPATKELVSGSVSFLELDGRRTTITLEPLARAWLRAGTGYGGPDPWRHGKYMGEEWSDTVQFDVTDDEITALIGPTHVLCRMTTDAGQVGYGTFETQVYGKFPRYGIE